MVTHPNASRDSARLPDMRSATTLGLAVLATLAMGGLVVGVLQAAGLASAPAGASDAAPVAVVPAPVELAVRGGAPFTLTDGAGIHDADPALDAVAAAYADAVAERAHVALAPAAGEARIRFSLDAALAAEACLTRRPRA